MSGLLLVVLVALIFLILYQVGQSSEKIATLQGEEEFDNKRNKIVGWSMSDRNNTPLVCDAFVMAVKRRGEPGNLILHSDQGSTYASAKYHHLLKRFDARCSMSRKGECLDNAVAESFFASLKTEWVDELDYRTREQAKQSVFKYIEVFYNRRRRHSHLNQQSPVAFEAANAF